MNKEQLIARAQELQIEVPDGATNAQISDLIKIAEHPILTKDLATAKEEVKGQKELTDKATLALSEGTTELQKANELIAKLEEKLAEATATPEVKKGEIYKNEEGEFEFTVSSFRFKGEKHTAEEAIVNEDLMESLIQANFIHLKKH
ncbi:hypothetical protein [Polaribacter ponticola]|uniref:Uncharacterized protein n=1 Tax=Polaribacter ponticola TaxID=2978475 RepID=A0ABT5S499_9FLAO|nr:hypothetical protein [Polaribacter sp. MSW5]MDD7912935.1 hypothetical protein [Polaribacter sp. MSW5]